MRRNLFGNTRGSLLVVLASALGIIGESRSTQAGTNFTTVAVQAGGTAWTAAIWDPGPVAPTAGNTYEAIDNGVAFGNAQNNTRIRNPASAGVQTFPGDSLTLNTNTELRAKQLGAILNFPGVGGQPGLILNGGNLNAGDDAVFTITGNILVKSTSYITPADQGGGAVLPLRGFNIAGRLSGTSTLVIYQASTNTAQVISGAANPFSGTFLVKAGWLKGAAAGSLGNANIVIDPLAEVGAGPTTTPVEGPAFFEVTYDIISAGALTLTNGGTMNLHQNCTFTAVNIEGTTLTTGKHTYDELAAAYPATFTPGGSGSISVIPHFTTKVVQGAGANWNGTIWDPGAVAPGPNGTYETLDNGTPWGASKNNTRLRNPATAGVQTFPGDSLTLNANTEIRAKQAGAILDFPGVNGQPGLILNGGVLNAGDDAVFTITGNILLASTLYIAPGDNGGGAVKPLRGFNIAGTVSGGGKLVVMNAGTNVAQEFSGNSNQWTGDILLKAGWLKGSGTNSLGTGNIMVDPKAILGLDVSVVDVQGPAQIEFDYNHTATNSTLILTNGGMIVLKSDITFKSVSINGAAVTRGTHPFAELATSFPGSVLPGGSGSITVLASSAQFTTKVVQGSGANWNGTIWDPGPVAPGPSATYVALDNGTPFGANKNNTRLRNPATAGVQTFPGDSLTLKTNTEIRAKQAGAILNFPGVGGAPGLILDGGNLNAGDDAVFTITGNISVLSRSYIVPGDNGAGGIKPLRGFIIAGQLSGSGDLVVFQAGTNVAQEISGTNTYNGTLMVKAGWLKASSTGAVQFASVTVDPQLAIAVDASVTPAQGPAIVEFGADTISKGTLRLQNGGQINLHQNVTFDKVYIEGSSLEAGVHTFAELAGLFPASVLAGGSGSIIVTTGPGHFATTAVVASGADWNGTIWTNVLGGTPVGPSAGNVYEAISNGTPFGNNLGNTRLRNPAVAGVQTFPGDQLILGTNTEIRAKQAGAILNFPGTVGKAGLVLNGGNLNAGDDAVFTITGTIEVRGTSAIVPGDNGGGGLKPLRGFTIAGQLSGGGTMMIYQAGTGLPQDITGTGNSFYGDWVVIAGWLRGSGGNSLGVGNITIDPFYAEIPIDPSVAIINGPAQVEVNYDIVSFGKLTLRNGGMIVLHQNCTFKEVEIEGVALTEGVHTYDELLAQFPANISATGSGSIIVKAPTAPPAPLTLTGIDGDTKVTLAWSASPGAQGYVVNRAAISGGPYTPVALVAGTSYVNSALVNGSIYYYTIVASNQFGLSTNSTELALRPSLPVVGITAAGGPAGITLNWTAFAGATNYTIMRGSVAGGPYTNIAGVSATTYLDTSAQLGNRYYYRVTGQLDVGFDTAASAEVNALTMPAIPTLIPSLISTTNGLQGSLLVRVTTPDVVAPQFFLERSTDGTTFAPLATLTGTVRYTDTNTVTLGATYSYRARATNATGLSAYSAVANVTYPLATNFLGVNFANSAAGQPVGNPAPDLAGYFTDGGAPFTDFGSGIAYGWDRDITPDGRWRQNAASPDFRYDTFIHLQKALPSAIFNIQVTNGTYIVHLAGGEATAADSLLQFNVEGADTPTFQPRGTDLWVDYTVTANVTDGMLTITSGAAATNNKIDYIEIYAAPVGQPKLLFTFASGSITVTWTGGGMLQSKTDLNAAAWTDINTSGSYSESTGSGNKFFRVIQ